jgi:hypothetical protein
MVVVQAGESTKTGVCRFCGGNGTGLAFDNWVRDTFTDLDKLLPGTVVCGACLVWFDEQSEELARRVGKDKPQRMRNYSHFVVGGHWEPLSKGNKARMAELLCRTPFPELAAIADSGQKHIVFRAVRNPQGGQSGWVQFEEQRLWVDPVALRSLITSIERLYVVFSKSEISGADYSPNRILKFGVTEWRCEEQKLKAWRGQPIFQLAIFLAQRKDGENGREPSEGGGSAGAGLEGDACGLQEPIPADDMGTIREPDTVGGIHEQHGKVYQLALFEIGG